MLFRSEDVTGPKNRKTDPNIKPGESALLKLAARKGLLGKDQKEKHDNLDAAAWVREAGNCAIHEPAKFDSEYADHKIAEVLNVTRSLLSKMYEIASRP